MKQLKRERLVAAGGLLVVGLLAVYVATHLRITGEVSHLLTSLEDKQRGHLASALADSELSRTLVISVGAADTATAVRAGKALAERLAAHPEVAWVEHGLAGEREEAFYALYFPRRWYFLSPRPEAELPGMLSDAALAAAAARLKQQLGLPTAPLLKQLAPRDPTLSFLALLQRFEAARPRDLGLVDGQLVTSDARHAIVFVGTKHSALDADAQGPLLGDIEAATRALEPELGPLVLELAGIHPFAVQGRRAIEGDIARISSLSLAAIVLIFLLVFRSLRLLVLAFVPLTVGMVAGLAAGLAVFGELHGLTLAFASTLIGICIDYAFHFFSHHTLAPVGVTPRESFRRVWPGLWPAAGTTVLGFMGLAASSLPGLQEVAVVSISGIAAALLTTGWLLPAFMRPVTRHVSVEVRLGAYLGRMVAGLRRYPRFLVALPVGAFAVAAVSLPFMRWNDDLAALNRRDPQLLLEDTRVRARIAHVESGRVVIATGADEEAALQAGERIVERLATAEQQGVIGGYRSIHTFLWSADLQRKNLAQLAAHDFARRMSAALVGVGFREPGFAPLRADFVAAPPPPLTWNDLVASPLASLVRAFRIDSVDGPGFLFFLSDVRDAARLEALLGDVAGATFFDQRAFLNGAYQTYRERTALVVGIGLLAVLALVALRYRKLVPTLISSTPALIACGLTLGVLTLAGIELNLLHLVALLMVFSMGVDYGIFMTETRHYPESRGATMVGLLFDCLSTVLGFGLLALSENPAMQALGLTSAIGILASFILAPSILVLLDRKAPP